MQETNLAICESITKLKLLSRKSQSAFIYFKNAILENIGAFLLNTPKTGILLE